MLAQANRRGVPNFQVLQCLITSDQYLDETFDQTQTLRGRIDMSSMTSRRRLIDLLPPNFSH